MKNIAKIGNIYRLSRNKKGYSIEQAADNLYVSVDTLRKHETENPQYFLPVPDDRVIVMSEIYNDSQLVFEHFFHNTVLGMHLQKTYGLTFNRNNLTSAALGTVDELNDFVNKVRDIIRVGRDGIIDETEIDTAKSIIKDAGELSTQTFALLCNLELVKKPA